MIARIDLRLCRAKTTLVLTIGTAPLVLLGSEHPSNLRLHCEKDGSVLLQFEGQAGGYAIEASADLRKWQRLGEASVTTEGAFKFAHSSVGRSLFYRVAPMGGISTAPSSLRSPGA